ncbi:NADH-quinone oxidoreductase subunit C [Paenibacillus sp. LHD-117]|uniref:NADH-quinone oxidoreductase subunit C n=1 Tax=Paenibacillus sp. LHD-117 TaxID=3071412 RepID=UPI0027E074B4|nr:NADH-quinone oxidoreductase subunit C [Paenibacillus sp. LHD-117]MDQ6420958.1 NADH-quinone oxidoreductase subunit C [Paenibacillus sp. LHD-117]
MSDEQKKEPQEPGAAEAKEKLASAGGDEAKAEQGGAAEAEAKPEGEPAAAVSAEEGVPQAAPEPAADPEREAKLKAAAEARAARAAAKAKAEAEAAESGGSAPAEAAADPEREAKLKAAAEARAARAAAKAKAEAEGAEGAAPEEPKPPSVRLPELELLQALLRGEVAEDAIDEAYLNELNGDMPTLVLKSGHWPSAARLLKEHGELRFDYLRNVTGVDYETHLEVVYHLLSLVSKRDVAVKVRTERDAASVPSATPVWQSANWNEREIYDLLGVDFPGHPDLRRIMMPDDWVGHPLRKDYEPLDSEV